MTEAEWRDADDPQAMWDFAADIVSDRKARLLVVALCRSLWPLLPHPLSRAAVEVAERFADGEASEDERVEACLAANRVEVVNASPQGPEYVEAIQAVVHAAMMSHHLYIGFGAALSALRVGVNEAAQRTAADVIRDVFGSPFRTPLLRPAWRTDTALSLARVMYETRDFAAMPILADALQDAGSEHADILDHCRDPKGVHVRGCWVVDLVLGK
jgi:hypothetical protein